VAAMRLMLEPSSKRGRVTPYVASSYAMFSDQFRTATAERELLLVERFYGVQLAIDRGYSEIYVEGVMRGVNGTGPARRVRVDIVGEREDRYLAVLCETGALTRALQDKIELLSEAENVETTLILPSTVSLGGLQEAFRERWRRLAVERLWWPVSEPEGTFDDLMDLMDLLANETRMRMLAALLSGPCGKRVYRREINPKLVYANLSRFLEQGLVHEADLGFSLTPLGGRIMGEYILFLERMRKLLEEARTGSGPRGER